ncbi:hypothetical protein N8795_02075 [Flavobacteriaceae bacterium]|nr:hypothetical protein [Flavobacteriaceae bacterium]
MKKGLLSILASALLVVGCQNYDDQFTNLESQISVLAQTVAGLSQVQSDLSSLAGTVGSLASTVNSLGSTIDTAVADGLADIQADITAIEAAVADVASSEEVSDLSDAVAASQEDLDELLANSSVFNGSVTINSEATLAAFKAIGSGLAIVNGSVNITVSPSMNQADVQTVVDEILTVTGDFTYTAAASTIPETTFNNLSGVQSLTLKQGGGYQAKTLASASKIVLNDAYKSTVTIVDFRALTSVTTIQDDNGTAGTVKFNKATEMHLTSLAYYPGANLNLQVKKGGVIDITALDDLNAAGTQVGSTYALTIDGPASAGNANIGDGTLTFTNVATVSVSGFIGKTVVGLGVENLTIDGAVDLDISAASDLVTANITGALDTDATLTTADTAGPVIKFASTDLTTATVAGVVASINATEQSNLENLTITADTKGGAVTIHDNDDLVSVTVTGAKLGNVAIEDNGDLETVTLDHTTTLGTSDKGATVSITGNTNMTSLTWSADDVDSLTITGNTQLATINFEGLKDVGTSVAATINIQSNALVASVAKDQKDAVATTDLGSYTSTSGMATLKLYLTDAMAADVVTKNITVYFDTIELVQTQSAVGGVYADAAHTDAYSSAEENAVAYAVTTAASGSTVRETESFVWEGGVNALGGYKSLGSLEGVKITYGSVDKTWAQGGTPAYTTVDDLITAINADTTFGSGITITAARDSYAKSYNKISYTDSSGSAETTASTGTVVWSLGTVTGTATIGSGSDSSDLATVLAAAITGTVVSGVKYGAVASSSEVVLTRVVTNTTSTDLGVNTGDFPDIAIDLGNATDTTVDFATGANTNSTGVNSDFFLAFAQTNVNGLRVTVKNNSTSVALAATVTAVSPGTALVGGVPTELVSGTNMLGNSAYDAEFANISTQTPASTSTKSRIGWL